MSGAFTAALLAGGKSSRMGREKALLEIHGVPLWQRQIHLIEQLNPAELLISGPTDGPWRDRYRAVPDAVAEAGPLAGICRLLQAASHDRVLILAVDLPQMTADFLETLIHPAEHLALLPFREDRFEPLAALYTRFCLPLARRVLESGNYSLQTFCATICNARLGMAVAVPGCGSLPLYQSQHESGFRRLHAHRSLASKFLRADGRVNVAAPWNGRSVRFFIIHARHACHSTRLAQ